MWIFLHFVCAFLCVCLGLNLLSPSWFQLYFPFVFLSTATILIDGTKIEQKQKTRKSKTSLTPQIWVLLHVRHQLHIEKKERKKAIAVEVSSGYIYFV